MILVCCKSPLFKKKSPFFLEKVCQSILSIGDVHNTFRMKYNVYMSFWVNKYHVSQSTYRTFNAHKIHCKVNDCSCITIGPQNTLEFHFSL